MSTQELIDKIKSKGYWKVEIRPTKFEKRRISTLGSAQEIIQSCIVSLRGWDYPYWDQKTVLNIGDWVESHVDWQEFIEYWRFYLSAKFIHLFALYEDYINIDDILPHTFPPRPVHAGYLDFVSVIFKITEIFEFAARLASKNILGEEAFISIELHNVYDHQLIALDRSRLHFGLANNYVRSSNSPIIIARNILEQQLISNPDEIAKEYLIAIFEQFQWNNPPQQILSEYQKKLREHKL